MKRYATIVIALAVLVTSGLLHGFWAERWSPATALQEAAARVDEVPLEFGDWQAQPLETDAAAFVQAGALKYWTRSYVNTRTKTTLLVILMCGRAGRMAVHTPEVCYRGAGYEMDGAPDVAALKAPGGEELGSLWQARFAKKTGGTSALRLYWGWNAGGLWQAPTNPRWELGGQPFLYKLYVSHDVPGTGVRDDARHFLCQLLSELHKILVAKAYPKKGPDPLNSGGLTPFSDRP